MKDAFPGLPCTRDDCNLSYGLSMSTCMGFSPSYNRRGERTDGGDPNITTTTYRCSTCKKTFVHRYSERDIDEWIIRA